MPRYQYTPLDSHAKTTRLVILLPASFDDDIRISLRVVNPCEVHYEALSYTWGSTNDSVKIRVTEPPKLWRIKRSESLAVTQNLAMALRYLRSEHSTRDMWIDAICIDQQNLKERGQQVGMMGEIYAQATRVVIWLGPATDDSALAMATLGSLGSRVDVDWHQTRNVVPISDRDAHWANPDIELPYDEKLWRSIVNFYRRPWFHRLWIWQEVLLAKRAEMYCGFDALEWNNFRKAVMTLTAKNPYISMPMDLQDDYTDLHYHMFLLISSQPFSGTFLRWLESTERCECTDPRDRVHALLHILHHTDRTIGLTADYEKTTYDVFRDTTLRFLDRRGELNFLEYCELSDDIGSKKPSWVPDWSKPKASSAIWSSRAAFGTRARAHIINQGWLNVIGVLVAEVSFVEDASFFVPSSHSTISQSVIANIFTRLLKDIRLSLPQTEEAVIINVFCRTLCTNRFADLFIPASSNYPIRDQSVDYLTSVISTSVESQALPHHLLDQMLRSVRGRCLFTTKEGGMGLSPKAAKVGDQVAVVLGCQTPLVLRRNSRGIHTVVGGCYIDGTMDGEALLGPLPSQWKYAAMPKDGYGYHHGFVNRYSGDCLWEDPRLGELPPGWRLPKPEEKADWENWFIDTETGRELPWPEDPRLTVEALEARGVPLQELLLE
ncbi:MAG: hypothetical protein Q9218_002352 [Villophora microphyllina]